ncbi:MAG: ribosome maturation factor RimP [Clostridia bacterium]|nr:ribosome maturation factor RimP [Clostridia bacterium]
MTKTEAEIAKMTKPLIEEAGYMLYDVLFVKEAGEWFLRFFIQNDNKKVDLDDCEKVSNLLSDFLDEKDPISESYNLEVSSCGLERHLREKEHFAGAIGERIIVKLFKNQNGKKEFEGLLKDFKNDMLTLIDDESNKEVAILINEIAMSKILYNWEELKNE